MLSKNKKRGLLNRILWYSSGLSIRDLAGFSKTGSNFFAIGGINLFSSSILFLLSSLSFGVAFPKNYFPISIVVGLIVGFLVYIFNRQTVNALSISESNFKNQKHTLTLLPLILFSIFSGIVISIPIKFHLFEVSPNIKFFLRLKELNNLTDSNVSEQITSWSFTLIISLLVSLPTLIQHYSLRSSNRNDRSSLLNELMWFCAGANKDILRRCPNDYSKYFGIGGTILFTALMATLSGGYAFFTAFDNASLAICFGVFWGAMIFNLDRFIVNTMYTDNKHTISGLEILSGLPRIIIAIFLGIVISYPLELKIFEDSIDAEMAVMKREALIETDSINKIAFSDITTDKNSKLSIQATIQKKQKEIKDAFDDWQKVEKEPETCYTAPDDNGVRKPYRCMKWPQKYYDKKAYYDNLVIQNNKDVAALSNDISSIQSKITSGENVKSGFDSSSVKTINALTKFAARSEAFTRLKENPKNKSISTMSLFIMILLIIIEIAPVFFKMMLASGDYDVILEADKNDIKVNATVRISQKNDWANAEILKIVEENKKKVADKQNELNAEMASNLELLNSIAKAQSEIAQVAITKWKESEIIKASENPENFINKNSNS